MKSVHIKAFGSYTPPKSVPNNDLSAFMDTSDEWIYTRSGIRSRFISTDENTSVLCTKAAEKILKNAGISALDIDIIIICTATADYATPSVACMVQGALGAKNAFAFDMNAACSGFIYGLSVCEKMLRGGQYKKALVIGGETLSKLVDWEDRSTCVLFGDGAGGVLLEAGESGGKESFIAEDMHSDGTQSASLKGRYFPVENPYARDVLRDDVKFYMDGRGIFDFVVKRIPESLKLISEQSGVAFSDVQYIVPHQANARIMVAVAKKMNMDMNRFYMNIESHGNTSAASIPIALDEMSDKGLICAGSGEKIILTGFGAGLTWGSMLIQL